ncbi:UNVERIFIED_CONTAM: hypothetical protein GTU68_055075, partial [Idotea baltica]|nr:hypothetical protein [Idotea baltica]
MLRKRFDRVLYIDLDVHHGDGVENAFCFTPKIMTVSLHMQEPGFFPGTGKVTDVGMGRGRFYSVNVPYKAGINDSQLHYLLQSVIKEVREVFEADAVVCQCGADTLTKDPLGGANISLEGYLKCIEEVLQIKKPTLFLGG